MSKTLNFIFYEFVNTIAENFFSILEIVMFLDNTAVEIRVLNPGHCCVQTL